MASGGVKKLAEVAGPGLLERIRNVVMPWALTGPAASAEFKMSLTTPDNYRPFSPASPPTKVIIPHSRPETTFDIKYFTRERRRVHEPAVNLAPRKVYSLDPAKDALEAGAPIPVPGARSALQRYAGGVRVVSLLDETNNGYT